MVRSIITGRSSRGVLIASVLLNIFILPVVYYYYSATADCEEQGYLSPVHALMAPPQELVHYNESSITDAVHNVVFVGGVPRSGTTLARAMLDAHPDVRCGEETRVIPRIISMRARWGRSEKETNRLNAAGITQGVLDGAIRAFVAEIILNHGKMSKYLCNKDPLVLNYMEDVTRVFPRARFLLMIRDGRAVAYSIVSRNVTISGVDPHSYMSAALFWNKVVARMTADCRKHADRCLAVHYEHFVADPKLWMGTILKFLGIPWHESVLHHHELINSEVKLSKLEPSSSQVRNAVHQDSVEKWRIKMPLDTQKEIYRRCDQIKELGYPP